MDGSEIMIVYNIEADRKDIVLDYVFLLLQAAPADLQYWWNAGLRVGWYEQP